MPNPTKRLATKTSAIQIMKQSDYKRMPWKNGLGETLEIHRLDDADGIRFRISQAAVVENGVFSDFSGFHRTLVLLSGDGMSLSHKNAQGDISKHSLSKPLDMARFSGGDETHATLHKGAIEDLNIMVRETDTKAKVTACFAPHIIEIGTDQTVLFEGFYANECCAFSIKDKPTVQNLLTVEPHSFMKFKESTAVTLVAGNGVFIQILSSKMPK